MEQSLLLLKNFQGVLGVFVFLTKCLIFRESFSVSLDSLRADLRAASWPAEVDQVALSFASTVRSIGFFQLTVPMVNGHQKTSQGLLDEGSSRNTRRSRGQVLRPFRSFPPRKQMRDVLS